MRRDRPDPDEKSGLAARDCSAYRHAVVLWTMRWLYRPSGVLPARAGHWKDLGFTASIKEGRAGLGAHVEQSCRELLVAPRPEVSYVVHGGEHGVGILIATIAATLGRHESCALGSERSEPV
jgi:hypothetical protein